MEPDGEDRYKVKLMVAIAAITGGYEGRSRSRQGAAVVMPSHGGRAGQAGVREGELGDRCSRGDKTVVDVSSTVQTGGPIARGPAPDRRRVEDDARQVLRVLARKVYALQKGTNLGLKA
jgi:hypothetical protein